MANDRKADKKPKGRVLKKSFKSGESIFASNSSNKSGASRSTKGKVSAKSGASRSTKGKVSAKSGASRSTAGKVKKESISKRPTKKPTAPSKAATPGMHPKSKPKAKKLTGGAKMVKGTSEAHRVANKAATAGKATRENFGAKVSTAIAKAKDTVFGTKRNIKALRQARNKNAPSRNPRSGRKS